VRKEQRATERMGEREKDRKEERTTERKGEREKE
jgi:hypothetical protein